MALYSGITLSKFTIQRPRLKFWPTYKVQFFYCLLKTIFLKVATIFSIFLIGFLRPLEPFGAPGAFWRPLELFGAPGAFCTPKYFPHHQTLIWPTYGTLLQLNNFNSKFWCPLLMAPPATPGQPELRYATGTVRQSKIWNYSRIYT